MLEVKNLSFDYDNNKVIENLSLNIQKGELITLSGPSGAGKSTLANLLAGHILPKNGSILLNEREITGKPSKDVFLIHQDLDLFPWQTVEEHLKFVDPNEEICDYWLEAVSLSESKKLYPNELSGGMKRRLALARAMTLKPKVLILDEVFSSQDSDLRMQLINKLKPIWKDNEQIVLLITHNYNELEKVVDKSINLSNIQ